MKTNLFGLASKKIAEEKRKFKEEQRKAAEKLRLERKKEKEARLSKRQKASAHVKMVNQKILKLYKSLGRNETSILKDDTYLEVKEDGNIQGKVGDMYFHTYQSDDITTLKTFTVKEDMVSDGDHYPTFYNADIYTVKSVDISRLGMAKHDGSLHEITLYGGSQLKGEYKYDRASEILEKVVEEVDSHMSQKNNVVKK